jgi:molybdate transport system regulatory protein
MNELAAHIVHIRQDDALAFIELDTAVGVRCCCVVIMGDTPAEAYRLGEAVTLVFKESEVAIAKGAEGMISLRNRFPGRIRRLKKGTILTQVFVDCKGAVISALISTRSADEMGLCEGEPVTALVKSTEMSLSREG